MGQAKNRGTFEERRQQALKQKHKAAAIAAMLHMPVQKLGEIFVRSRVMEAFKVKPETADHKAGRHPG